MIKNKQRRRKLVPLPITGSSHFILPAVEPEVIHELIEYAKEPANKNNLFMEMAIANPVLYTLIMEIYNEQPPPTPDYMLGIMVAMYHMLQRQVQKVGLVDTSQDKP